METRARAFAEGWILAIVAERDAVATRRVYIEDCRHNDAFLRATWHAETRVVVISHWSGEVCTAATPIPIEEASKLIGLLVTALQEAAASPPDPVIAPSPIGLFDRLARRLRRRMATVVDMGRFQGSRCRRATSSFAHHSDESGGGGVA